MFSGRKSSDGTKLIHSHDHTHGAKDFGYDDIDGEVIDFPTIGLKKRGKKVSMDSIGIGTDNPYADLELKKNNGGTITIKDDQGESSWNYQQGKAKIIVDSKGER